MPGGAHTHPRLHNQTSSNNNHDSNHAFSSRIFTTFTSATMMNQMTVLYIHACYTIGMYVINIIEKRLHSSNYFIRNFIYKYCSIIPISNNYSLTS